ncbi:MAG: dockerin type I domain-containing protein, partial [Phycisphaerae bacterium]
VNVDPAFVNAAGRDYRLSPGSAIIDAGDSTAIGADTLSDVSGLARLVNDLLTPDTGVPDAAGAVVDLGAFEFFETALTAISLLDHNGAELGLNLSNNIEPRAGGVRKILLATGATVANVNATVTCANTVYAGAATVSATSNEVTLTFAPPLPDEDCCAIQLAGDLVGTLTVRTLHGDIDRNGRVTTGDASIVRFFFGQTAATAGPQYDVNQDGIITPDDFGSIMPLFNHVAPTCP